MTEVQGKDCAACETCFNVQADERATCKPALVFPASFHQIPTQPFPARMRKHMSELRQASQSCYAKLPQTKWFKTTKTYSSQVLESRSLGSGGARLPQETLREKG